MGTIYCISSMHRYDGTQNHDCVVSGLSNVVCIHCRNVKNIRNNKIYQWSDE